MLIRCLYLFSVNLSSVVNLFLNQHDLMFCYVYCSFVVPFFDVGQSKVCSVQCWYNADFFIRSCSEERKSSKKNLWTSDLFELLHNSEKSKCYTADSFIVDEDGERCSKQGLMLSAHSNIKAGGIAAYVSGMYVPDNQLKNEKDKIEKARDCGMCMVVKLFDKDKKALFLVGEDSQCASINRVKEHKIQHKCGSMSNHSMSNHQKLTVNVKLAYMSEEVNINAYVRIFHHLPANYLYLTPINDIVSNESPVELLFNFEK